MPPIVPPPQTDEIEPTPDPHQSAASWAIAMKEPSLKAEIHRRLQTRLRSATHRTPLWQQDLPLITNPGDHGLYFWWMIHGTVENSNSIPPCGGMWGLPFRHDNTMLHYHWSAALLQALAIKRFPNENWEERARLVKNKAAYLVEVSNKLTVDEIRLRVTMWSVHPSFRRERWRLLDDNAGLLPPPRFPKIKAYQANVRYGKPHIDKEIMDQLRAAIMLREAVALYQLMAFYNMLQLRTLVVAAFTHDYSNFLWDHASIFSPRELAAILLAWASCLLPTNQITAAFILTTGQQRLTNRKQRRTAE